MSEPARSIADVAEALMHEFERVLEASEVTAVVIRLSRSGAGTLPALAEAARQELAALAATAAGAEERPGVVALS